jgi:hypothetical protein
VQRRLAVQPEIGLLSGVAVLVELAPIAGDSIGCECVRLPSGPK